MPYMILSYLKYRRFALVMWLLAAAAAISSCLLGGVSADTLLYCFGLSAFAGLLLLVGDLFRYRRLIKRLRAVKEQLETLHAALPEAENGLQQELWGIVEKLQLIAQRERSSISDSLHSQVEYYTTWLHQIKTPISCIRLAAENGLTAESTGIILGELVAIERYVDMALQNTKLQDLESDLVLSCHSVDTMLLETVKKYSTVFIQKRLTVDFSKTFLTVITDSKWFSFIIEQLLSNSAKYTPSGGVKIYADGATLYIEDSGIGIRSDDCSRIFEWGYTGYNGRTDRRASGLGLYMSRKIAERLNITLLCDPSFKGGSRFTLDLSRLNPSLTKM